MGDNIKYEESHVKEEPSVKIKHEIIDSVPNSPQNILCNATEIATVQQSFYDSYYGSEVTNNLDEYTFSSSDITYDDDGTAI